MAQYGSGPAPQAYAGAPPQSYAAPYGSGAPLPAGWQELYTQDGRNAVYYFNTQTRETSWTRPSAPSHADIFQQPAPMGAPQSYAGAPPQAYGGAHQVQYGYGVPPQSYAGAPAQSYSGATVAAQYGSGPAAQAYPAAGYPHQPELLSQTSRSQGMLKAAALSVAGTCPTVCRKLGTRPLARSPIPSLRRTRTRPFTRLACAMRSFKRGEEDYAPNGLARVPYTGRQTVLRQFGHGTECVGQAGRAEPCTIFSREACRCHLFCCCFRTGIGAGTRASSCSTSGALAAAAVAGGIPGMAGLHGRSALPLPAGLSRPTYRSRPKWERPK